jgi:23S rRNA (cytidine1920-2'-O)/16S rRNA (cytidine1409-2'-O)-methyltransferase
VSGKKARLDLLLLERGLVESREKAKALIMAGRVEVDRVVVDKPGRLVATSSMVSLTPGGSAYASRGGDKLEAALRGFDIDVKDLTLMDVGASAGGFTDCLLRRGAGRVVCVDVGYGQLDWRLRQDPRVVVLEKTNARYLTRDHVPGPLHGAVIDVSFISLRLVVPPVSELLEPEAFMVALIKPQFEVGRGQVGKGGVVRDERLRQQVIETLSSFFEGLAWSVQGVLPSPLLGPKGNQEYLIYVRRPR